MTSVVYLFSVLCALAVVGLRRRRPDLFTIAVVAHVYYSSTLFFGEVYDPENHIYVPIPETIYNFYSFLFIILSITIIAYDQKRRRFQDNFWRERDLLIFSLTALSLIFILINALDHRAFFPREIGGDSAASFGALFSLYWMLALIYLYVAVRSNDKAHIFFSMLFLLSTLLAGSRAYFTAGLIGFAIIYFQRKEPVLIASSPFKIFLGFFAFTFLILFKNFYQYLLVLDFDLLLGAASNWDLIVFRLTRGGESVILLNFIHSIEMYDHGRGSFTELFALKLLPFISEQVATATGFTGDTLSDLINASYYSTVNYGMASSFWGLFYYTSGWIGVIVAAIFYCMSLFVLQRVIQSRKLISIFLIPGAVFLAFYVSRLEIGATLYPFYLGYALFLVYLVAISLLRVRAPLARNIYAD